MSSLFDFKKIDLKVDLKKMTVQMLNEKVLKKELCMVSPDVEILGSDGTILISSEGETDDIIEKLLQVTLQCSE